MKCPKCQHENPEDSIFCGECGSSLKIEVICPNCGSKPPPSFKFCNKCGHDLREPNEAPPVDYSEPQSYTPKFLADKILTTRSAIEGERKLVTVLFADVANYTSISEKLDPEEVHQIMDGCFKILMDKIHNYEGTINQFTGDGVMSLFGAPVAHEEHAQRACHAALSIQKAMSAFGEKIQKDYGVEFKMRIGLNSGPVIVGSIGDDLRMDYTAVGDTTNLASRMESMASPGTILVSRYMHRLIRDFFEFGPLREVAVKGKEEPQQAYELLKAGRVETRIGAAVAKGLTRFVGRKNSFGALKEAVEETVAGSGQVVAIVGEAGVGKSRLLHEFKNLLLQSEYAYLEGRCFHFGGSMSYLPFLDILRSYFEIKEGDREFIINQKMTDKIAGLDENLESVLPPLRELFSLKVEDEDYLGLDPKQKRERAFEAIRDLLIRESQGKLLVVVVEDLHWIDKTSEDFLNYLIGWLASTRILLILLYRPEYTHQWGSKSYYRKIGLNQLTAQSSAELVQAILEDGEVSLEIRELILYRAAGNPLFMEEFTHTLLENGSIQRKDNQYVLSGKESDIQVPDTIQGIIAARMDRLEDNLKQTMQVASVIGRDFAFRILQTITGLREELKGYLINLQGLEFIYEKSLFPELEYIFKHALTQEVAYNSLLQKRRKEIHAKIGGAIEQIYAERLEEFYEVLAYHFSKAEEKIKAFDYLLKAGDKAVRLHARQEATTYYDQALTLARGLPDTPEAQRMQIDVSLKLAAVGSSREDMARDQGNLAQAQALAEALTDDPRLAQVLYWLGRLAYVLGDFEIAIPYAEQSLALADRLEDEALSAPPVNLLGRIYTVRRDCARGSQLLARSTAQMHQVGNRVEEATAAAFAGGAFGYLGAFEPALAYAERGVELARDLHDPFAAAAALFFRGQVHNLRGAWAHALADYDEARRVAEGAGDRFRVYLVNLWEGWATTRAGNPAAGRVLLEQALAFAEQMETTFSVALVKAFLAACCLALGELDTVPGLCQEALRVAGETSDRFAQAVAHRVLAEALGGDADRQPAEQAMGEAIRLWKEIEWKPELARSYVCYARLLQQWDQQDTARAYLTEASSMFQEMSMDWDLAQAEQVLGS